MGVAIKTECVREINRLNRVDRTVQCSANQKSQQRFCRLAMQAARRVKSSKKQDKTRDCLLPPQKSALDGLKRP